MYQLIFYKEVKQKINFKTYGFLPKSAGWFGIIALGFASYSLFEEYFFYSFGLFVLAGILLAPSNGIEIDFERQEFNSYISFLGFRKNDIQKFDSIAYVYIQRSILRATSEYRSDLSSSDKITYNGFLMFSGDQKIHLVRESNKSEIIRKCKVFSNTLGIPLFDSTSGRQVAIN